MYASQLCRAGVFQRCVHRCVLGVCAASLFHRCVREACSKKYAIRVCATSVLQRYVRQVRRRGMIFRCDRRYAIQVCLTRVSYKFVLQARPKVCPQVRSSSMSYRWIPQARPSSASQKRVRGVTLSLILQPRHNDLYEQVSDNYGTRFYHLFNGDSTRIPYDLTENNIRGNRRAALLFVTSCRMSSSQIRQLRSNSDWHNHTGWLRQRGQ